jgi:GntR family transcriptional repressor for pyruvate dehydrogenase complex
MIYMKKVISQPIQSKRLPEIIETHIRDLILNGEIIVGEKLPPEKDLSAQFGVSLATTREALKGLEAFGLIEKRKGRQGGIFVSQTKIDLLKIPLFSFLKTRSCSPAHLTEIRVIIEPAVARIATSHISHRAIKDLESNIKSCEAEIAEIDQSITEEEFFSIEKKNIEFHRLLAEATTNPVLVLTIDYVMDLLFNAKQRLLTPDIGLTIGTIKDHWNILSYIKKGDADGAEKEMVLHLTRIEQYLRKEKQTHKVQSKRRTQ